MPYPIFDISGWRVLSVEEMGSKPKFWVQEPGGSKWLFKHRHRPYVGDDWAEKIAAEVAETLGIPHATVELARFEDKPGIISKDLVGTDPPRELVLGNSLLVEADPTYPGMNRYHVAEHTIDRVFTALGADFIDLPEASPRVPAIDSPIDLFVGYLLLDALIGNTDRHHENWAIIQLRSCRRAASSDPVPDLRPRLQSRPCPHGRGTCQAAHDERQGLLRGGVRCQGSFCFLPDWRRDTADEPD